jgi:hypothetical protein
MRVLHMDTGREMRGGQYQVLFLMRELRKRGVEQALCARRGGALEGRAVEEGFRLARTSRKGFEVYHAHDARAHTQAALRNLRPLVVSRRVAFPVKPGFFSRWKYRRADLYLAVSRFVAGRLREAGIPEGKIRVVYDAAPEMPRAAGDEVLAPATADPRKGSALATEAAGRARVELKFSSDLAADLVRARLLVYLSEEEGLGSAALLAQAAGVPVLASRVGGLPEAVEDGVTGRLVENDAGQVARGLREMLEGDLAAMGEAALARWGRLFTLERMAGETLAAYEGVRR